MKVKDGKVLVEAYDQNGKGISCIPNGKTSNAFCDAVESTFKDTVPADPT
jgi:hypothetical protein